MKIARAVALSLLVGCSSNSSTPDGAGASSASGSLNTSSTSANGGSTASGNTAGGSSTGNSGTTAGTESGSTTAGTESGSTTASTGSSATGASSASSSTTASTGGTSGIGGGAWNAGNPDGSCSAGLPAEAQPADTSHPTTVVGTGTAASCTFDALSAAVANGGVITFDCGTDPVTIPITGTLQVPTDKDTVLDGNRLITLDGQNQVQILSFDSPDWQANEHRLTLQHLALINAKTTPTEAIPPAPPPCSQGWDDGQGGAVYMRDGNLTVIDCIFTGNQAAPLGPDTGGGAIYVQGSKHGIVIAGSTFTNNAASNAGAVGGLFTELHIYNSLFTQNSAIGSGANNNDPDHCSVMNNGQNETGSGGNGGAIYSDGNSVNIVLCGDKITDNHAGMDAFGGGLFFTSNNFGGTLTITDTTMVDNTGGSWTTTKTGTITNAGSAVGTNCKSITIENSTLQGYP